MQTTVFLQAALNGDRVHPEAPRNPSAIAEAARGVPFVVTVEEHTVLGGLGGLVAEILGEREPRRLVRIGIADTWGESAPNAFLLDRHGLSPERVAERVASESSRKGPAQGEG